MPLNHRSAQSSSSSSTATSANELTCGPEETDASGYGNSCAIDGMTATTQTRGGISQVVQAGDTLWDLSVSAYGMGSHWLEIADANVDEILPGYLILVGTGLVLPMLDVPAGPPSQSAQPVPDACHPAIQPVAWVVDTARAGGDVAACLQRLDAETVAALRADPSQLATLPPAQAIPALTALGVEPWAAMLPHLTAEQLTTTCDPALEPLLLAVPSAVADVRGLVPDNAQFVLFLQAYSVPMARQLGAAGFDANGAATGPANWDLLMHVLTSAGEDVRQQLIAGLRASGQWAGLMANVGAQHVAMVQSWLAEDAGDGTNKSLQDRIAAATNSARGQTALAAVNGVADPRGRLTPRLKELLALGVALPALESNDLAREGVLSVNSATRAATALTFMPDREYLRLLMLMEGTGDAARLQQQFLLLEATAARANEFTAATAAADAAGTGTQSGNLTALEGFSDSIRGMDRATAIRMTSATQVTAADQGMVQKYTDSCGVTSNQMARAGADPVEALRMRQNGELAQNATGSTAAQEQATVLGGAMGGQAVCTRADYDAVSAACGQIAASACTPQERQAILDYVNGRAFSAAAYGTGIPKLAATVGGSMPSAAVFTNVRAYSTSQATSGVGMLWGEVTASSNGAGNTIETATGRTSVNDAPNSLWQDYLTRDTNGDGNGQEVNAVTQPFRAAWIRGILDRLQPLVDAGNDVRINFQWDGGGGHYMTCTDVRTDGGRRFLVADPWSGKANWITDAQFLSGVLPSGGSRGCLMSIQG